MNGHGEEHPMDEREARQLARAIERERKGSVGYQILRALLFVIAILGVLLILAHLLGFFNGRRPL